MAPCIPTHRPLFTATRVATAVAVASMISSLVLLLYAPTEASSGTAIACAASVGGLR